MSSLPGLSNPNHSILFVLGAPRSGTTYLNRIIDVWFGYGMGPEGTFVSYYARRLSRYGDLSNQDNLERLANDMARCEMLEIVRHRWREGLRFDVTPEWILRELPEPTYAGLVYAVFKCVALGQGKSRVGNKNPRYYRQLDLLHQLFPTQARYIFVVRDGRDVALSLMKEKWGAQNAYSCARIWKRSLDAVARFSKLIGKDRLLQIRYEDLLSAPRTSIARLEEFLDVRLKPEQTASMEAQHRDNPRQKNYFKWRKEMTARDLRIYEAVAGKSLEKWGYQTICESPTVPRYEALYYRGAEFLRKVRVSLPR